MLTGMLTWNVPSTRRHWMVSPCVTATAALAALICGGGGSGGVARPEALVSCRTSTVNSALADAVGQIHREQAGELVSVSRAFR